jgi:hypothetical protein
MHARNPYPIDDEPKCMDASRLNGFKASAARARETILSHNNILWNKEGGIAREGEDLPNLSPEDVNTGTPNAINGKVFSTSNRNLLAENCLAPDVAFATQMVDEERNRDESEMAATQNFDPYQSYLDPGLFDCYVPLSQPDEIITGWHMNSFEEWLGGLQFSAETANST